MKKGLLNGLCLFTATLLTYVVASRCMEEKRDFR